ncbi:MAG TPA: class I SAM-dependent methyltransferase [Coleofasciculaceae cyanobacterium]
MTKTNINLQPNYWNQIWDRESTETWRRYPGCFGRICWAVGHFNEVLELGCGTGLLARQLLEFGNTVTGLDISEVAISQLPKQIRGIVSTLPKIPFSEHTFDVVVGTEILEHIDDDITCVQEAIRVLRPGGRAYFAVPNNCLGPEEEPEHVRKYTSDTLDDLLSPYGDVFIEAFVDEFIVAPGQIIALPTLLAALYTSTV